MAIFQATVSKQFTNTCQTLTVTDTSNYGFDENVEHRLKEDFHTRIITLRDIFQNVLAVQTLTTSDTATFNLSLLSIPQLYLDVAITLQGSGFGYENRVGSLLPCIIL